MEEESKMMIKTENNNFDEEDMHKLESILSLDYLKPIQTSESKKKAHTAVIVLTPLLYIFAVFGLVSKNYTLFTVEIVLAVFFTAWLIWYYTLGKKTQENLQNIIANALEKGKNIQLSEEGISADALYKYEDIETVIIYEPFYFWITKEKKLIIMKINPAKEENIRSILDKHQNITIIKTDKPFNVYKYLKDRP